MSKFHEKMAVLAIILPRMASFGAERSFLLILFARDDLVKVLEKSDARKCQNQVYPSYFDWLSESSQPLCNCDNDYGRVDVDVTLNVDTNTASLFENKGDVQIIKMEF